MYCPHCGAETELVIAAAPAAPAFADEVRIAEINAARDIELAKLARRTDADYNETRVAVAAIEAEAEVGAAEATAEVVAAAIAGPEDTEPDVAPIVVEASAQAEETPDDEPPDVDDAPAPSAPGKGKIGLGMW